jgi:hypothetical protein
VQAGSRFRVGGFQEAVEMLAAVAFGQLGQPAADNLVPGAR